MLGVLGHVVGWPLPRGGSQAIADALAAYFRALGGEIVVGERVDSLAQLPPSRAVLCDITPRQLLQIAGDRLPPGYRRQLGRFRYGAAAFKLDYALSGPIPWRAAECARAATVHLGGTLAEVAASERAMAAGRAPDRPFVLLAQQSLFDPDPRPGGAAHRLGLLPRAERLDGRHDRRGSRRRSSASPPASATASWPAPCPPPPPWNATTPTTSAATSTAGVADLRQLFTRPTPSLRPYRTPVPRPLPLLVVHPPWRRRSWHVRLLGRPHGLARLLRRVKRET